MTNEHIAKTIREACDHLKNMIYEGDADNADDMVRQIKSLTYYIKKEKERDFIERVGAGP